MRACADDADRAALVGIPVRRVHSVVWMLAALLAFLAVFLRAGIVGLSIGTVLGPSLLLPALAAAVIGRMERLPTIAMAAIALGIVEQSVVWGWNQPSDVQPVLFVVVLVAVWLTPAGSGLRGRLEPSTWRAIREPRPVPRELARLPEVRIAGAALLALVALALVLVPVVFTESRTNLAAVAVIYGMIALSLVVLTGWAGEISLGQMAFVAIGAAAGGSITARLGWDLSLGLLGAGLVGAAVAAVIGLPVLRRRGLTLAVITLAFSLATTAWLLNPADLRRRDTLRLAAAGPGRASGSLRRRPRGDRDPLLLPVPRGPRAGGDRGARHPAEPHRTGARRDPRERVGGERIRREPPPHDPRARSRSRASSPPSRGPCSSTTRTACNSTRTPRARASSCSRWS